MAIHNKFLEELKQISAEKVLSYEEVFSKIEEATGISDMEVLVQNFIRAEEKNFTMFRFVNDQSQDIENLENKIGDIQGEIESIRDSSDLTKSDIQKRKDIKAMEEKLR